MIARVDIRPIPRSTGATLDTKGGVRWIDEVRRACVEFPTVAIALDDGAHEDAADVSLEAWWREALALYAFDARIDEIASSGRARLVVAGRADALAAGVAALLTRCQ